MTATGPITCASAAPIRAAHTVASLDSAQGGLARSVPALVAALNAAGVATALNGVQSDADLAHIHGLWLPLHHAAVRAARQRGIPYVVSPRGMLEPWALAHRRWKKRLAWQLYQKSDLRGAALLHATSEVEAASIRRLGLRAPIALIPNGVDVPSPLPARARGPVRRALFLSRLHPVKGLPLLIEAWSRVRPDAWELVLAGPDEGGYRAAIEALVRQAGLPDVVTFAGPVADADKWALYRTADLVVLPTHSENFGLVVAEALGAGVPVLTTKGAPWRELETHACGWWTDVSADAIAAALAEATQTPRADLDAMGERGRALVLDRYGWEDAALQVKSAYEWILGTDDRPACVTLD